MIAPEPQKGHIIPKVIPTVSGTVPGGSYICGIGLLNTHNIPRQSLSTLYLLVHHVDLYTKPSFYIHPRTKDKRANLTEFMLVRVITFVGNLVGDRGSIFLPIHGRPRVTIRGQTLRNLLDPLSCNFSRRRLYPSAPPSSIHLYQEHQSTTFN